MQKKLQDKIIAITGATGTIGAATAKACALQGATVILIGRKQKKLEALYDLLVDSGAPEPALLMIDFANATSNDFFKIAETIFQTFGRLDGLFHAATQLANLTPLAHTSPDKWRLSMQVTLDSAFYLTQACLPLLENASDKANVIFCHHEAVTNGQAYWGSYAVAKSGLNTLMHIFSQEYEAQAKIYFNSIDPVCVNSALQFSVSPAGAKQPFSENAVAEKIATLLDNPTHITGQTITMG